MPWSAKDASSKDKDADTPAKQETWAKIANDSRLASLRKGMTEAAASRRAIRTASSKVN